MKYKDIEAILKKKFIPETPIEVIEMRHQYYGKNGITWTPWYKTKKDTPRKPYQGTFRHLKNEYREIIK